MSVGELTDNAKNLARGRLLLQGLSQVPVAGLQLLEQPDVLDGDDGLVGKGLEQGDLPFCEGSSLGATKVNGAEGDPFSHHGHGTGSSGAPCVARWRCPPGIPGSACMSAMWIVRPSGTARPLLVPRTSGKVVLRRWIGP